VFEYKGITRRLVLSAARLRPDGLELVYQWTRHLRRAANGRAEVERLVFRGLERANLEFLLVGHTRRLSIVYTTTRSPLCGAAPAHCQDGWAGALLELAAR